MKDMEVFPQGWKRIKLGEVAHIIMGQSPPGETYNIEGKGIPFLQGKQEFGVMYPSFSKFTTKPLKIAPICSVLISVRAPVGDVNIANNDYCIGRGLASLSLLNGRSKFLFYLLKFLKTNIEALGEGSTFQAISKSRIFNLKILLPPLLEQKKIAEILETVDNSIEKTDAIIEKYKRIKQGLMQDLLTKGIDENWQIRNEKTHRFNDSPLGRIPEEWKVVDVFSLTNVIIGGTPDTSNQEYWNGDIYWLSIEDFNTGKRWVYSSSRKITEKGLKGSSAKILEKGAIVISARGTVGAIAQLGAVMAFNQSCYGLDVKNKDILSNDFLYFSLYFYIKRFLILAYGNVFDTITKENFKQILIPLLPLPEQNRIATVLSQIDEVIEKERAYREKLERIKKGLMDDLLTGKVRVNCLIEEADESVQ